MLFSTALVLILAIPAAYSLSIRPVKRWRNVLFFFLTTKMLPYVAAVIPIFIVAKDLRLLNNEWSLVHPLHVYEHTHSDLDDQVVPHRGAQGAPEAARIDGAACGWRSHA